MYIKEILLENFRSLEHKKIEFSPKINLITGKNGSGKTSLLEAIYYLGRLKSFRTSKFKEMIKHNHSYMRVIAKVENPQTQIGIEKKLDSSFKLRINNSTGKPNLLIKTVPSVAITSDSFMLINSGPINRRQFMDYGVFYFDNSFYKYLKYYQKALKNRNAGLKQKMAKSVINSFTPTLIKYGIEITKLRSDYFEKLSELLQKYLKILNFEEQISIKYQVGWNAEFSLEQALENNFLNDTKVGHTRYGPHRADIKFSTKDGGADANLSRGQQKTLIIALYLAQIELISFYAECKPILIIDDISSELDKVRRNHILKHLTSLNCQMFFSATEENLFEENIQNEINIIKLTKI